MAAPRIRLPAVGLVTAGVRPPRRVAYLTVKFPFGPTEAFFEPEVRSLARLVEDVAVVPIRPVDGRSRYEALGATNVYLPPYAMRTLRSALAQVVANPAGAIDAFRLVLFSRYRPIAKLKNLAVLPSALAFARLVRHSGYDHIHAQWLTTPASVAMIASRLTGVPWSASAHQQDIFAGNLIPEKLASAAFIRVISERNRTFLLERAGTDAGAKAKTALVYLGVDLPEHAAPQSGQAGTLKLICVADLHPYKGHTYLLQALRRVADTGIRLHCDLAGDGSLREALRSEIAELRLHELVTMRGYVAHAPLLAEIREGRYDVAVLASTEKPGSHEGIPVAMMEAMAAGVPCVSTRSGSLTELIDDTCGILVPQRDPVALADALVRLAGDSGLRARLAENGRARIRTAFETNATTRRLVALMSGEDIALSA